MFTLSIITHAFFVLRVMKNMSILAHLRLVCRQAALFGLDAPSTSGLLQHFEAMQQHDKAPIIHNLHSVSRMLVDDKADDTCIINSLQNFLSQSYILENNGVLITHLLDEWKRPLTHPLLFKGDGRNRLFWRFCLKHPSDFEMFKWKKENDSVRGVLTTEARQLRVAKQIVYEGDTTFFIKPDVQRRRAATPSKDPLLKRPITPPRKKKSLESSSG